MWDNVGPARGYVRVGTDPRQCQTCEGWMATNGATDPSLGRGNAGERIPAERPELDSRWRDDPDLACRDAPPALFWPDPDPDEDVPAIDPGTRREVARRVCGSCPVRHQCRDAALGNGYEGLWGGALFGLYRWDDLLTGESGDTVHAAHRRKREHAA